MHSDLSSRQPDLKQDFGMTDNQPSLMIHFLSQNNGLLSKRVKKRV